MSTSTRSKRSRGRAARVLQKPAGTFHPRVQQVGPEHFGIVSVDCAKARSKWMLADFFGKMAREHGVSQNQMETQFIAQHRPTSVLKRLATPEEVANMVVYVCSPQASATTGAALRVDGGVVRSIT